MSNTFTQFAQWYTGYFGYPVLFLGVLLENMGLPVPGETAVLVAGFVSSPAGGSHFSPLAVIATTFCAAVLGDNVGFWLGREFARPRLQKRQSFLFLTPERFQSIERYFNDYGRLSVFLSRFISGVRVICALAAGAAGMPWDRFVVANAAGAMTWAIVMTLAGYYFGKSWNLLEHWLGWGAWIFLALLAVVLTFRWAMSRKSAASTSIAP